MTDDGKYVKLLIKRSPGAPDKYLIALRTTADYYGWSKEFPTWRPEPVETTGGKTFYRDPGRIGSLQTAGGRRHRICRTASTAGQPRGFTNQFRLSGSCGNAEIAELAHFTQVEWYWMEGLHGERITKERWEEMYQAIS